MTPAALVVTAMLCGSPADMLPAIYKAGERHVGAIPLPSGSIQIFAKLTGTKSWTVFYATPAGTLCILTFGTGYRPDKEASYVPN